MQVILIGGGSCSGKTTLARAMAQAIDGAQLLAQDSFYICQSERERDLQGHLNFDIPEALDFPALSAAIRALKNGTSAQIPVYDFSTHSRTGSTVLRPEGSVLIVEGTLVLCEPRVRACADYVLFVRAEEDLRRQRRERRDIVERGRSLDDITRQLDTQVFPAHDAFVEPSAAYADRVLDANDLLRDLPGAVARLCQTVKARAAVES